MHNKLEDAGPVFQNPGVGDELPSQPLACFSHMVTIGVTTTLSSSGSGYVRFHCISTLFLTRVQLTFLKYDSLHLGMEISSFTLSRLHGR